MIKKRPLAYVNNADSAHIGIHENITIWIWISMISGIVKLDSSVIHSHTVLDTLFHLSNIELLLLRNFMSNVTVLEICQI